MPGPIEVRFSGEQNVSMNHRLWLLPAALALFTGCGGSADASLACERPFDIRGTPNPAQTGFASDQEALDSALANAILPEGYGPPANVRATRANDGWWSEHREARRTSFVYSASGKRVARVDVVLLASDRWPLEAYSRC